MSTKFSIVLAVVAAILLYLFLGRKSVAASTAPVNQTGTAAGGANFISLNDITGLPVFDPSSTPAQYIQGPAQQSGGQYVCSNGTTPAVNAATGAIYCVIPAQSGIFSSSAPVVSPYVSSSVPQGPTQSGGYLGGPMVPQGPTPSGGYLGQATPAQALPDLGNNGDPTGLQDDSTIFAV
jgi:hypothetical protein